MSGCRLCPRECGADRAARQMGVCHADSRIRVARAALHYWEEPCICGKSGSGAVFFTGCPLGCCYCQNREIALGKVGWEVTAPELSEIFFRLQEQGAVNINLVTAGHYAPDVAEAIALARGQGLRIPVLYNSSGYEKEGTLRLLDGLVDIYLPDLKYADGETARRYSRAADYPEVARKAIAEMVRQCPAPVFDGEGMLQKGVIVRHLLLPGHVRDAREILRYLHDTYGEQIFISILSQYTPMPSVADDPLLRRKVTRREYERLLDYACEIGIRQGFFQDGDTAKESFIPAFDGEGVHH